MPGSVRRQAGKSDPAALSDAAKVQNWPLIYSCHDDDCCAVVQLQFERRVEPPALLQGAARFIIVRVCRARMTPCHPFHTPQSRSTSVTVTGTSSSRALMVNESDIRIRRQGRSGSPHIYAHLSGCRIHRAGLGNVGAISNRHPRAAALHETCHLRARG